MLFSYWRKKKSPLDSKEMKPVNLPRALGRSVHPGRPRRGPPTWTRSGRRDWSGREGPNREGGKGRVEAKWQLLLPTQALHLKMIYVTSSREKKNSFERQSIVSTEFCCSLLHFPGHTGVATTQISADFHSAALFRPCFYKEFWLTG